MAYARTRRAAQQEPRAGSAEGIPDARPLLLHTPEFAHESSPARVKNFLRENGITHPVVMANDSAIWNRWNNRYWPARFVTGFSARGGMPRLRR